jgi:hypothetical protein
MVLYRSLNALTLATILFFSPSLANAKPHHYRYHRHDHGYSVVPPYGYGAVASQDGYDVRGGSACIPWCRLDTSPCDPVYFKKADNRCDGVIW